MTELEKLEAGLEYCYDAPEVEARKENAILQCKKYNAIDDTGLYPVKQTMKKMASCCRIETTIGGHSHGKKVYESRASDQHH